VPLRSIKEDEIPSLLREGGRGIFPVKIIDLLISLFKSFKELFGGYKVSYHFIEGIVP